MNKLKNLVILLVAVTLIACSKEQISSYDYITQEVEPHQTVIYTNISCNEFECSDYPKSLELEMQLQKQADGSLDFEFTVENIGLPEEVDIIQISVNLNNDQLRGIDFNDLIVEKYESQIIAHKSTCSPVQVNNVMVFIPAPKIGEKSPPRGFEMPAPPFGVTTELDGHLRSRISANKDIALTAEDFIKKVQSSEMLMDEEYGISKFSNSGDKNGNRITPIFVNLGSSGS